MGRGRGEGLFDRNDKNIVNLESEQFLRDILTKKVVEIIALNDRFSPN
jgi:hypothetical protein